MCFKFIIFYLCAFSVVRGDRSFTIVLDTTISMLAEIDIIKTNIGSFFSNLGASDISNYVIVPFNDEVRQPVICQSTREVQSWLNTVSVSGGKECPENSLSAVERALQASKPGSKIFLFTDAYPKDSSKLSNIQKLCRSTHNQVVILLTGFCLPSKSASASIEAYYNVAEACSGAVLRLEPSTLRQAFAFMKKAMEVDWTVIRNYGTFVDYKQFSFPVYSFATDMLVVVTGEQPMVDIIDPSGFNSNTQKIVDSKDTQILRLTSFTAGQYTATIRCKNKPTTAVLYMKYEIPIRFGFAIKSPRSIKQTSTKPIPGRVNHVLFDITQEDFQIMSVEIQVASGDKKPLDLEENSNMYLGKFFVEPDKEYRFWIKCYETSNSDEEIVYPTPFIQPQKLVTESIWMDPKGEILETDPVVVSWHTNATLACKVEGYPKPNIWWEDDTGKTVASEDTILEIPSVHISYATLDNFETNTTIYCKSKNSRGKDSQQLSVFVYRPFSFEVKQSPQDRTIEYGNEEELPCEISAYPEADIEWYFNGELITDDNDLNVVLEENGLSIINMTTANVGNYKCKVKNGVVEKSFTANIKISGIEKPEIEINKSEYTLSFGEWTNIECKVIKGKPYPTITWKFKGETDYEFEDLPDGVLSTLNGQLKIGSVHKEHKGTYRCEATNEQGQDSAEVIIKVKYAPIISKSDTSEIEVKEDEIVAIRCDIDASPAAEIRWEHSQGDVLIPLDTRHHIVDEDFTLKFTSSWKDSGKYHCIAENEIGRSDQTTTVNVLVSPYIATPKNRNLTVKTGSSVLLECRVIYGNPTPTTKWEFAASDSTPVVLLRSKSILPLRLTNLTRADSGKYSCITENKIGIDNIKYYLNVQ